MEPGRWAGANWMQSVISLPSGLGTSGLSCSGGVSRCRSFMVSEPSFGRTVGEIDTPDRTLLISILREGVGFVPTVNSELRAGDDVLMVLDPRQEEELKRRLGA